MNELAAQRSESREHRGKDREEHCRVKHALDSTCRWRNRVSVEGMGSRVRTDNDRPQFKLAVGDVQTLCMPWCALDRTPLRTVQDPKRSNVDERTRTAFDATLHAQLHHFEVSSHGMRSVVRPTEKEDTSCSTYKPEASTSVDSGLLPNPRAPPRPQSDQCCQTGPS